MPVSEAIRIAEAGGLDLVEVSPKADPPVCRIMDYGRFKYEKSKQAKAARKNQNTVSVKEVKFRPKTDTHDFDVKVKRLKRFIEEGHKAKLTVVFRGREIVHPETGQSILQRVVDVMGDQLHIDHMPIMEGRRMVMSVSAGTAVQPKPEAKAPEAKAQPKSNEETPSDEPKKE